MSRWDRLKDPIGIVSAFAEHVHADEEPHLLLAGPDVTAVADDPEGAEVFEEVEAAWRGLPQRVRRRVHLALLPMDEADENAVIVNALQRRADVVVQKSLAEGFGLTVSEAMWKGRPVVASDVGGIQDQIEDGQTGYLVEPTDLAAFADRVNRLLADPHDAERMGEAAQIRVRDLFLGPRHLGQYVELLESVARALTAPSAPRGRGLCGRHAGDRHAEGRAADVVQAGPRRRSGSMPRRRRARRRSRPPGRAASRAHARSRSARARRRRVSSIVAKGERSTIPVST